jgi:tetratricopeptide (TPR) repeat protein
LEYYDVDVYERRVTTSSPEAQTWFNRGLVWTYAYFHDEAVACFHRALDADPTCAMAHWGIAYAAGPNYNMPWERRDAKMRAATAETCHSATLAALKHVKNVTPFERAMIEALPSRFPQGRPESLDVMRGWNDDFADAMRTVCQGFPGDLDVACIFVEAIMNRTPWKMWDQATGDFAEGAGTKEAQDVLEQMFDQQEEARAHPGLLHLYVHLMEMSPTPEKALKAGDALRELVPDAGHLMHMPTHIDVQCGHYRDVFHWNWKATQVDRKALENMGVYTLYTGYRIHNYHFAVYGAMFLGQYEPAMRAARELVAVTPEELLRVESPPFATFFESYFALWVHVMIRFGKWRELIAEPLPEDTALWANLTTTLHYAKAVAHAALSEVPEAEAERERFLAARDAMPEDRRLHNVLCLEQLAVAEAMLDGEIEYRKGNYDVAYRQLRKAVFLEDALPYDEPWGWMQPTRHALGALLLEQGHVDEAEAVYREDLGLGGALSRAQIHPDNVWSLRGLNDCLVARGASESVEGRMIAQRLALAEGRADGKVGASCYCAQAAQ